MPIRVGQSFGCLTVERFNGKGPRGVSWICKCTCGKLLKVGTTPLIDSLKVNKKCGHERKDWTGLVDNGPKELREKFPLTFTSWKAMFARCVYLVNKNRCYENIKICEKWHSFVNFLKDMGRRPSKNHSIDRKDPDGDYEPSNCRWLLKSENSGRVRKIFTEDRMARMRATLKQSYATGKAFCSEHTRKRIAEGAKKRIGRKFQTCTGCGNSAYLPLCQKCRNKQARKRYED